MGVGSWYGLQNVARWDSQTSSASDIHVLLELYRAFEFSCSTNKLDTTRYQIDPLLETMGSTKGLFSIFRRIKIGWT